MSGQCKKLLIFGATGLVGKRITAAIVQNKASFDRIAVFTSQNTLDSKPEAVQALRDHGVDIIVGDLTRTDDVAPAYKDVDTVISCLGRNMLEHQIELIRLADANPNVHRFFPSEYGTDIDYDASSVDEKPHQKKLKVRAFARECTNLDFTFLVTGPYADGDGGLYFGRNSLAKEAGTFDVKGKEAVLIGDGTQKIGFTTMRDVGKLLVAALVSPASKGAILKVNSFVASDAEILQEFEKQSGEKWTVSYTSLEKLKQLEADAWAAELPYATLFTLKRIWAEGKTVYSFGRDNDKIGAEGIVDSLSDAVREAIKIQLA